MTANLYKPIPVFEPHERIRAGEENKTDPIEIDKYHNVATKPCK